MTTFIEGGDVEFTGTWSSSGSYYAAALEVVCYGQNNYICVTDNVGQIPTIQPTKWNPTRYWSPFVLAVATPGTQSAYVELAALIAAETGTRSSEDQYLQNQIEYLLTTSGSTGLAAEAGTRSQEDQNLQNQITGFTASVITEQGTRSQEDQYLQNQITSLAVPSLSGCLAFLGTVTVPNTGPTAGSNCWYPVPYGGNELLAQGNGQFIVYWAGALTLPGATVGKYLLVLPNWDQSAGNFQGLMLPFGQVNAANTIQIAVVVFSTGANWFNLPANGLPFRVFQSV
jgi:hypothetical protein